MLYIKILLLYIIDLIHIIKTNYILYTPLAVSVYQFLQECLQYTTVTETVKVDIAIMLYI